MKLLEPIKVGNIEFKNRIMFPPLTTGYEEKDGSIGEQSFRFYERLAKGGVGYIVIGDVAPLSTFSPTPKLYSPQQAEGFQRLADACHKYGAKLYETRGQRPSDPLPLPSELKKAGSVIL